MKHAHFTFNFKSFLPLCLLASLGVCSATEQKAPQQPNNNKATNTDLLRFANNDTLHGTFLTFDKAGKLLWKNSESPDPIVFDTAKLNRIVINHNKANRSITYKSAVHLVNGDIIPGSIQSANRTTITLDTDHLGKITIPLNSVHQISTTPFGGKLLYYGPLNQDGWKIVPYSTPAKKDKKADKKTDKKEKQTKETSWYYIANSWYSGSKKNSYLVRKNALPDQCSLSFNVAWKGNLYIEVILHADFAPPKYTGDKKINLSTGTVGHAYVLTLSSHSASLASISFDENGQPKINRLSNNRPNLSLAEQSDSHIEIRLDKPHKSILLYTDGEYKGKWDLGENYEGKGNDLAFSPTLYNKSQFRISEVAIAKWNGMKDSAKSMSSSDRDVILLSNGIDRFSGTFQSIKNDTVNFQGTFNNNLSIPIHDVQEIHLATKNLKSTKENTESASEGIYFYIYPYGRITGTPSAIKDAPKPHLIQIKTPLLGNLQLDTRYINLIDFSQKNSLLELWDDNF